MVEAVVQALGDEMLLAVPQAEDCVPQAEPTVLDERAAFADVASGLEVFSDLLGSRLAAPVGRREGRTHVVHGAVFTPAQLHRLLRLRTDRQVR